MADSKYLLILETDFSNIAGTHERFHFRVYGRDFNGNPLILNLNYIESGKNADDNYVDPGGYGSMRKVLAGMKEVEKIEIPDYVKSCFIFNFRIAIDLSCFVCGLLKCNCGEKKNE